MKKIILFVCGMFSIPAFSAEAFLVEPMICVGKIQDRPRDMHESYSQVGLYLTSFKSTRTDRTLVDSLQVETQYASETGKISMKHDDFGSEMWFMGPLYRDGKRVYRKSLSGREDDLDLKITKERDSKAVVLKGTWTLKGTVVGDYIYKLSCTANVVESTTRVDDNTALREKNAEAEMKSARTVAECKDENNSRVFKVGQRGQKLVGFFKDFSPSSGIKLFDCERAKLGTGFKCFHEKEPVTNPRLITIVNLSASADGSKQAVFSLANSRNEQGGGDYLHTVNCKKATGF